MNCPFNGDSINADDSRSILTVILTVRFMKLKNFFSISVMMEKSPLGRCSLTVVTFIWGGQKTWVSNNMNNCEWEKESPIILCYLCACVWYSHLAALAEAAQQQSSVGGNNAVLHMLACMLQSYSKHKGERKRFTITKDMHCLFWRRGFHALMVETAEEIQILAGNILVRKTV